MNRTRVTGIVLIAVLVGVVGFGAYAFAQSRSDVRPWRGEAALWHRGGPGWGGPDPGQVQQLRTDLAAELAAHLDTTGEDVEAAFRAVVADRLEEAVAAGDIDQARADEALAAYDEGDARGLFRLFKR
jgi:hypothetical protein